MSNFIRKNMGKVLRQLRKEFKKPKITQAQMAEHLGLTVSAFSDYERGKTLPPLDTLYGIGGVYGASVGEMIRRMEQMECKKKKKKGKRK